VRQLHFFFPDCLHGLLPTFFWANRFLPAWR